MSFISYPIVYQKNRVHYLVIRIIIVFNRVYQHYTEVPAFAFASPGTGGDSVSGAGYAPSENNGASSGKNFTVP